MKKQVVMLLGVLLVGSFAQAQKARHIKDSGANCVLHEHTQCDDDKFTVANSGTSFARAALKNSFFKRASFTGGAGNVFDMRSADLLLTHFNGVEMSHVDAANAKLDKADFSSVPAVGTTAAVKTKLNNVRFNYSSGHRAKFVGAEMNDINFDHSKFRDANFESVEGIGWSAKGGVYFNETNFHKANLKNVDFTDAELTRANFSNSVIKNGIFEDAKLDHANFRCADIQGANLKTGHINQVNFVGANLKGATVDAAIQTLLDGHSCFTIQPNGKTFSVDTDECAPIFMKLQMTFDPHAERPANFNTICP